MGRKNVEKTYWCEKGLVGAGYAGRCDAYVKLKGIGDAIIDLKNRKVNKKYTPPFYPTDAQQLWAYRNASENPQAACVSVVLASNDPEYIDIISGTKTNSTKLALPFARCKKSGLGSKRTHHQE
jgi:hypothetical protein